ncbi:hypothetical protein O3P69_013433 [Scylla paramamosain]|uniref:NADP-dependent oxidoreductase domain-containing protein n=1 Tax=Scylla paramamosain TaxID=85552 RepID=A0AAW0U3D6_SCYPA
MCEQELAKVLNLCWRRGDTRNEFFIITKLPLVGMKWNMVSRFLDISLKNLGLNYVDAFLMEAPVGLQSRYSPNSLSLTYPQEPETNILRSLSHKMPGTYILDTGLCA